MTSLERIAHAVICIVKYGSPGGTVSDGDLRRVTEYLGRVFHLPERPKMTAELPDLQLPTAPKPPTIRLPGP